MNINLEPARSDDRTITFPLARPLTVDEVNALKSHASELFLVYGEFKRRRLRPKTLEETLIGVVPEDLIDSIPASMDIVGDLAIIELADPLTAYGSMLGEAIMRVNSNIKGVFSKAGAVSGEYRVRPLQWLAGKHETLTEHKENGRRYLVDISIVYFSPRLSTERLRVAQMIPPSALVLDLFAGVGPYSILMASRGCNVIAVDVNPHATALLKENARLNKVADRVTVLTGDARTIPRDSWWGRCDHVIMNLPGHAFEFLDLAVGALRDEKSVIHFYCFAREPSPELAAQSFLKEKLDNIHNGVLTVHEVRRVRMAAPREWQIGIDLSVTK